jgi:hypothetical protein
MPERGPIVTGIHGIIRRALFVAVAACGAGLIATIIGWDVPARTMLVSAIVLLLMLPALHVVAAAVLETRRRAWRFVAAALVVLAVLAWEVAAMLF